MRQKTSRKATSRRDKQLSLGQHLEELRHRLLITALAFALGTGLVFIVTPRIFHALLIPAGGIKPVFIDVTEMLSTYFKVALMGGFTIGLPVFLYELVMFIAPGLTPREKRYLYWMLPMATLLFVGGALFSYFIFLPPALDFLLHFGEDIATPQIRIGNYISVVTRLMVGTGVVFETPLAMLFLAKMGLVSYRTLARGRRWAVVMAFVVGAIITPTMDPVNQTLIAVPVMVLYELGIWLVRLLAPGPAAEPVEAKEG
ncbi:MAG: twin-arginine translocase subunit TatC [Dehalococcoidia bacterium]